MIKISIEISELILTMQDDIQLYIYILGLFIRDKNSFHNNVNI